MSVNIDFQCGHFLSEHYQLSQKIMISIYLHVKNSTSIACIWISVFLLYNLLHGLLGNLYFLWDFSQVYMLVSVGESYSQCNDY